MSTHEGCDCPLFDAVRHLCPRYGFSVNQTERQLCEKSAAHRDAFARPDAPQHVREKRLLQARVKSSRHPKRLPIGDWMAGLFKRLGVKPTPGCGCRARQEKLNSLGERLRAWLAARLKTVRRSGR